MQALIRAAATDTDMRFKPSPTKSPSRFSYGSHSSTSSHSLSRGVIDEHNHSVSIIIVNFYFCA